jgi:hypothetical protein
MRQKPTQSPEYECTVRAMGGEETPITVPGDMVLSDVLRELTEALHLPRRGVDGKPAAWSLDAVLDGKHISCNLASTVSSLARGHTVVKFVLTRPVVAG